VLLERYSRGESLLPPWLHKKALSLGPKKKKKEKKLGVADIIAASGVLSAQSDRGFYHLRRAAVSAQLKSKVGLALGKETALRNTLNLDGTPIISRTHNHPSYSHTSRLLTSSLSLGVPVPRATQCIRDA
jgi:hypothetical protein